MTSLIFDVIGKDHASKVFKEVGDAAHTAEGKMSKLKAAGAVAFAALAVGAAEFGRKSIEKFQEVGGETLTLQRQLGLTATQASRLRFAGEETGVTAQMLGQNFGILSKHLSANDKAWKSLGVSTVDAHGKTKSMNDLIPEIAEKFKEMPNGAQKTALAMNLFGRSGKQLLPFLNKGADGIKDLEKESDKYGNTLDSKDTKAVYANVIAKRQLSAATTGLEIQLGQHLLPAVTSVVTSITSLTLWFAHMGSTGQAITKVIAGLVAGIGVLIVVTKIYRAVQAALDVVMSANPIGLAIASTAALVAIIIVAYKKSTVFRDVVNDAFHGVVAAGQWMWKILKPIFGAIETAFNAAVSAALWAKNVIGGGGPSPSSVVSKNSKPGNTSFHGGGKASGGPIHAGVRYMINERGRETVTFPANGIVHPANLTPVSGGSTVVNHYYTLNLSGMYGSNKQSLGKELLQALQALQESSGRPLQLKTI